jgi:hypothetical protein
MLTFDYKEKIENWFYLKTKTGEITRFIFNDVQQWYYDELKKDYPDYNGIREHITKGRQFGLSTMWSAIFTVDFIASECGEIPIIDSDVYSHKDKETTAHFNRINMFLDSYLLHSQGGDYGTREHHSELPKIRKAFLSTDTTNLLIGKRGARMETQTASAKVSGRGSTKQNIHWTEPAFYPNTEIMSAETLMTGAEEQVPQGFGKIVRESTGNLMGDYFAEEYYKAKEGVSDFKARFIAWYLHKDYSKEAPKDWIAPTYYDKILREGLATVNQCYWHYQKTRGLQDKKRLREYPTTDTEAFLMAGTTLFDSMALIHYQNAIQAPRKAVEYVQAL